MKLRWAKSVWIVALAVALGVSVLPLFTTRAAENSAVPTDPVVADDSTETINPVVDPLADLTAAIEQSRAEGNLFDLFDSLIRRGEAKRSRADIPGSFADLLEARQVASSLKDPVREAIVLGSLGAANLATGNLEEGEVALSTSVDLALRNQRNDIAARSLVNRGALRVADQRPSEAIEDFSNARSLLNDARDYTALEATIGLARATLSQGNHASAWQTLKTAPFALGDIPVGSRKAKIQVEAARTLQRLNLEELSQQKAATTLATSLLLDAVSIADGVEDGPLMASAISLLASFYERVGRYEEALTLAHRALAVAQLKPDPALLYEVNWVIGRQLKALHRPSAAIDAYQRAADQVRGIRYDLVLSPDPFGTPFRARVAPLFQEMAELLLDAASATNDGVERLAMLRRVRDALEVFKSAEIVDFYKDDCVSILQSRATTLDTVEQGTAVLYPVVLPDRLVLLVTIGDQIHRYDLPVSDQRVLETSRRLRLGLEKVTTRSYIGAAQELYDWLIRPAGELLASNGVKNIVFVPDGALRGVPLAALHDGSHFLVERYTSSVAPGISLIEPATSKQQVGKFLAAALTVEREGFAPLPGAETEVQAISTVLAGTTLKDSTFTRGALKLALTREPHSILHIASHAKLGRTADESYVLAFDGPIDVGDLTGLIKAGHSPLEPIDLFVMSACETAAGDDRAALGLAGLSIRAGARSALASLWQINDLAASELMTEFYRNVFSLSADKTTALREAQLSLLKTARFRHPGYWAPYLLVGAWR